MKAECGISNPKSDDVIIAHFANVLIHNCVDCMYQFVESHDTKRFY